MIKHETCLAMIIDSYALRVVAGTYALNEQQPMETKMMLTEEEINNARATLNELQVEHRDLNLIVEHLVSTPLPEQDQLLIHRLKKRKLLLKDKICQLECLLVPDIEA